MREWLESLRPEQRDFLRAVGGVAVAAGALALFIRKSSHGDWGSLGRLLILLVPCVVLYGLGLGVADADLARTATPSVDVGLLVRTKDRLARPWQSVLVVLGVVLIPLALAQFVDAIGGDSGTALNAAWIFLVTAALALYAAFATGVSYASLLAGLALIVSWLSFCDKAFNPSASTFRWLLILAAAGLVAIARALERQDVRQAPEFVTAAGLAAVAAGILGLVGAGVAYVGRAFARSFGTTTPSVNSTRQHVEWDVLLLLVAALLIWYGNRRAARGPAYVGALALSAFVISVGLELTRLFSGNGLSDGGFLGWPALLLVAGAAALLAGFHRLPPAPAEPPAPPEQAGPGP